MLCGKTREKHGENARFVERGNRVFDQFDLKTVGLGSFMHEGMASNASFRKMPNQHYADTCTRLREHRFCIICVRLSRAHFQELEHRRFDLFRLPLKVHAERKHTANIVAAKPSQFLHGCG